ncbi:MAG: hypothetical protein HOH58_02495, partial [Opitutaceae bacterium]|nr:hypothetical protein [Opitutaceae bacterium]
MGLPLSRADVLEVVPAEVDLLFAMEDLPATQEDFHLTPLARLMEDPQWSDFVAPMWEQIEFDDLKKRFTENTGIEWEEASRLITGGWAFFLDSLDAGPMSEWEQSPDIGIVLEVGKNEDLIAQFFHDEMESGDGDVAMVIEEYDGVEIFTEDKSGRDSADTTEGDVVEASDDATMFVAVFDGVCALTGRKDTLLSIIDRRRGRGVVESFRYSPQYDRIFEREGFADWLLWLHAPPIYSALQTAIGEQPVPPASAEGQMPLRPTELLPAFGGDDFHGLYVVGSIEEDYTRSASGILYEPDAGGLWQLMPDGSERFPSPEWMPQEWNVVGTAAVDLSLLVPVLEGIAEDLNPAFIEMWNGMNLQFSQNFGVDLKEDIFGALGTGIIMAQFHEGDAGISFEHTPMGQQPQLLAFKLRDADRLRLTWTTLQARMFPQGALPPGMEARDYLGQEIVLMKSPSPISPSKEQVIALCITDEYFIISLYSTYPLERALQMLAGDEGGSLWDRPDVEDDMAWTPREAVGLNRQDLAVVFAQVFGSLKNA